MQPVENVVAFKSARDNLTKL
uniref:Uncharacterized protein n=1 Tax=Anguilla anguilla TaxID=7936 RepID=A0A0E9WGS6_ANGAN